jgi:hypothetical protein
MGDSWDGGWGESFIHVEGKTPLSNPIVDAVAFLEKTQRVNERGTKGSLLFKGRGKEYITKPEPA